VALSEAGGVTALIVGTVLALVALAYVLWPIISAAERRPTPTPNAVPPQTAVIAPPSVTMVPTEASPADAAADDALEAEIRRARAKVRVCATCGPRPEPGARYCSRCGRPLA
jgi:hypothetical protein